mmetsp:Transcript_56936/g.90178  ORF Transcript_56936/g.90178 Transcript_56936/m.90178 type:complete len:88 (-) Transcript_56936:1190-1453(-)
MGAMIADGWSQLSSSDQEKACDPGGVGRLPCNRLPKAKLLDGAWLRPLYNASCSWGSKVRSGCAGDNDLGGDRGSRDRLRFSDDALG